MISKCRGSTRLNKASRHFLERLGQQRVVGVGEGLAGNRPGRVPLHHIFIDQQAHQFRHGDRRMRIVELDDELLVEVIEILLALQLQADHVLQ
jgi:hypothetical protein